MSHRESDANVGTRRVLTRRNFLKGTAPIALAGLLAACGGAASTPQSSGGGGSTASASW